MMTGWLVGADAAELRDRAGAPLASGKARATTATPSSPACARARSRAPSRRRSSSCASWRQAGLTRIMGQHLLHRDLDAVELMGREIVPALAG